ncbi:uncharacterized protein LOC133818936 isoform X2 [Humulus lupulus]|uniref:uncharacterized protein LOC133818936 isoform X2 n=1 Tax=Humulus lupulus TaxID=3486 RepID=UPI002B41396F|nr:uncharacterized protein LOC133818936 isoform X2 [Humulus lupulus]XP_062108036.1 uncharacterized protein LOC133818936 isoform X2 [Humulus lupulus]XP_062108037.1 uncharacterized protein LOC133818936 isoform X2 [Humulus lupulus]XP_062108039.1 uncharacterized protein LOC133818936 isoform X2 [Humulus lupulus]
MQLLDHHSRDPDIIKQLNTPSAQKRKTGEGSSLNPPSKVVRTTPPNQGRPSDQLVTIPRLTPPSISPSASLQTIWSTSLSEPFCIADEYGKELPDHTLHHTMTTQTYETLPRQIVEVVLHKGLAEIMTGLITISHAQHRAVDYEELVKVLNDQLVEAQTKIDILTKSEKDLQEKTEQAEKAVTDWDRSLKEFADENNKKIQANKRLTDQLVEKTQENEELKQDKENNLIVTKKSASTGSIRYGS